MNLGSVHGSVHGSVLDNDLLEHVGLPHVLHLTVHLIFLLEQVEGSFKVTFTVSVSLLEASFMQGMVLKLCLSKSKYAKFSEQCLNLYIIL